MRISHSGNCIFHLADIKTVILASMITAVLFAWGAPPVSAEPLRIGANAWPGYEPLFLASRLFNWSGRDIALTNEYPSTSSSMEALGNKLIDAAGVTLDEALLLRRNGVKVKIILVLDHSFGGDAILAKPEIGTIQQLRGKRLGVENDAVGGYLLERALEKSGMAPEDVKAVHLHPENHEKAFLNGDVDAVVTFEPMRSRLLAAGALEVFSSKQIPGEITDVLIIREDAIAGHEKTIREIIMDWFRAVDYMKINPGETFAFFSRHMKLSLEETKACFGGLSIPTAEENGILLAGPNPALKKPLLMIMRRMTGKSILSKPAPVGEMISGEFLP